MKQSLDDLFSPEDGVTRDQILKSIVKGMSVEEMIMSMNYNCSRHKFRKLVYCVFDQGFKQPEEPKDSKIALSNNEMDYGQHNQWMSYKQTFTILA